MNRLLYAELLQDLQVAIPPVETVDGMCSAETAAWPSSQNITRYH